MNEKKPAYSSSSYSGADIKVIATLSHEFLSKWKKELMALKDEEEKLLEPINREQRIFNRHDPESTRAADIDIELDLLEIDIGIIQLEIDSGNLQGVALQDKIDYLDALNLQKENLAKEKQKLEDYKNAAESAVFYLKAFRPALLNLQNKIAEKSNLIMGSQVELGTVQTISCQSHRPKAAVRAIGSTYARGYTRGPRTIAGSIIFTVLNKQSLHHLCKAMGTMYGNQLNDRNPSVILPDQLPPIDLTFIMANEYGSVSRMALYGVEFLNSGYTFSIEDLLLEEVVQFIARDIDPMTDVWDTSHNESRDATLHDTPMTAKETLRGFLATRKRTKARRNL